MSLVFANWNAQGSLPTSLEYIAQIANPHEPTAGGADLDEQVGGLDVGMEQAKRVDVANAKQSVVHGIPDQARPRRALLLQE
mgnify:CR=1 FL=1